MNCIWVMLFYIFNKRSCSTLAEGYLMYLIPRSLFRAKNIVKDSSYSYIICFTCYLREGDIGQSKHERPDFQIAFIQELFSSWTKACFAPFIYVKSLWSVQSFLYLELHFIVLPASFTFFLTQTLLLWSIWLSFCSTSMCSLWNLIAFQCNDNKSLKLKIEI